ncbi:MAG TPA: hypothetical protein VGO40_11745 [Longimicrobium sp.]|jgi:hypothetical protein|nr:hypothetical protein [Longimicrobium sp.]
MQAPAFRARSVPELLDAAFQVLRARYPQLLTAALVICMPAFVLDLLAPAGAETLTDAVHSLLLTYASAAAVVIVSDAYLGRERGLGEVLRAVFSRFGSIWGTGMMTNIMIAFGLLLLVVPGVYAFIVTFAMVPAVVLEGASTSQAFDRSRALARGNKTRIFFTLLLAFMMMMLAFLGILFTVGFLTGLAGGMSDVATTLVSQAALTAAYPFLATVSVLLYYDARIRNEAFDIQMLMEDAQGLSPAEAGVSPA